jgi:hypothetical protein
MQNWVRPADRAGYNFERGAQVENKIGAVTGPQVWRGAALAAPRDWAHRLDNSVLVELDAVVRDAASRDLTQDNFDFEAVEITYLRQALTPITNDLAKGRGFAVLRGMEPGRYTTEELKIALLVIGNHMGLVGPQELQPKRIGEVMDINPPTRDYYYHGGGPLPMHMDPVDVVGLLCIRKAKRGGASRIVSSMEVHNEILCSRPDLLELLYRGYQHRRREHRNQGGVSLTKFHCPIFAEIGGRTICNYIPAPIRKAIDGGLVNLTPLEQEALDVLDQTAARDDLCLAMDMEPGDIQFLNNRLIMHGRADYEDFAEPEQRRLMLRLWLTIPGWQKYPENLPHTDVELETEPA